MNKTDLGWTAGLLEGEGYFCSIRGGIFISCSMTDKEPIEKLQALYGGTLLELNPYKEEWKKVYRWYFGRKSNCIQLVKRLQPLMSPRRQTQIQAMIDLDKIQPFKPSTTHGTRRMYEVKECRCQICVDGHRNHLDSLKI